MMSKLIDDTVKDYYDINFTPNCPVAESLPTRS